MTSDYDPMYLEKNSSQYNMCWLCVCHVQAHLCNLPLPQLLFFWELLSHCRYIWNVYIWYHTVRYHNKQQGCHSNVKSREKCVICEWWLSTVFYIGMSTDLGMTCNMWVMVKHSLIIPRISHGFLILTWTILITPTYPPNWVVHVYLLLYLWVLAFLRMGWFWLWVVILSGYPQAFVPSMWTLVRLFFTQHCCTARIILGWVVSYHYNVLDFLWLEWPIDCWYANLTVCHLWIPFKIVGFASSRLPSQLLQQPSTWLQWIIGQQFPEAWMTSLWPWSLSW